MYRHIQQVYNVYTLFQFLFAVYRCVLYGMLYYRLGGTLSWARKVANSFLIIKKERNATLGVK